MEAITDSIAVGFSDLKRSRKNDRRELTVRGKPLTNPQAPLNNQPFVRTG